MKENDIKTRTTQFALDTIRFVESLPRSKTTDVIGKQLLRCATSVGANYRAACRAKSQADFVAKLAIVEEEADESQYWMELLVKAGIANMQLLTRLMEEANQLTAIMVSSIKTSKTSASHNRTSNQFQNLKSKI